MIAGLAPARVRRERAGASVRPFGLKRREICTCSIQEETHHSGSFRLLQQQVSDAGHLLPIFLLAMGTRIPCFLPAFLLQILS